MNKKKKNKIVMSIIRIALLSLVCGPLLVVKITNDIWMPYKIFSQGRIDLMIYTEILGVILGSVILFAITIIKKIWYTLRKVLYCIIGFRDKSIKRVFCKIFFYFKYNCHPMLLVALAIALAGVIVMFIGNKYLLYGFTYLGIALFLSCIATIIFYEREVVCRLNNDFVVAYSKKKKLYYINMMKVGFGDIIRRKENDWRKKKQPSETKGSDKDDFRCKYLDVMGQYADSMIDALEDGTYRCITHDTILHRLKEHKDVIKIKEKGEYSVNTMPLEFIQKDVKDAVCKDCKRKETKRCHITGKAKVEFYQVTFTKESK